MDEHILLRTFQWFSGPSNKSCMVAGWRMNTRMYMILLRLHVNQKCIYIYANKLRTDVSQRCSVLCGWIIISKRMDTSEFTVRVLLYFSHVFLISATKLLTIIRQTWTAIRHKLRFYLTFVLSICLLLCVCLLLDCVYYIYMYIWCYECFHCVHLKRNGVYAFRQGVECWSYELMS